ncbi:hypothetical protein PYW07_009836 [Mythimna separata]|uniref:Mutant cadherin n=2 Tax=Mythimna separata TaxID=271217 RepID=A0AAD8DQF6_MYTSE|nr:hypothetical protein PYW07_009836 [Mythimna separata]
MSNNLVVNELLAFLQQKLDVMDEVSAVQICATNFSEEDIAAAKLMLFTVLNKRDQMVSRRRDGTRKSIQDIITLFKETDPDDVPTFVAKELHKLPPVTFDHVDVTTLLKDIVFLKASLADVQMKLDASQKTVAELRQEFSEFRNTAAVTRSSADASNANTRRGVSLDLLSPSSVSAVSSPVRTSIAEIAECPPRAPRSSVPAAAAPPGAAARPRPHCPAPLPEHVAPANLPHRDFASVTASAPAAPISKPLPNKAMNKAENEDGFVTVQRRKRRTQANRNLCGKAPATPGASVRAAQPNTPVYISRLHYTTKVEDIVEYVRQKLKYTLRVQLLESHRNVNFQAFVVRVPNCFLHLAMNEDFWPQGVVFRRFRGQVPQDSTKKT